MVLPTEFDVGNVKKTIETKSAAFTPTESTESKQVEVENCVEGTVSSTRFSPEAGAFYVMDRGYIDFERLYVFTPLQGIDTLSLAECSRRSEPGIEPASRHLSQSDAVLSSTF